MRSFELTVSTRSGGTCTLRPAWAAPYFVLVDNTEEKKDTPLFYHAESLADAKRFAKSGTGGDTTFILDKHGKTVK